MKSSSSKILIVGGIIIGIFGLVCLVSRRSKKNVRKSTTQKSEVDADEQKKARAEHDEGRKPANKAHKISYSTPESLIENVLKEVLKEGDFMSIDDFLSNFITMASLYCEDYSWFDYFPKSSSELREVLGKYGLREQFDIQLYNKFKTK